MKTNKQIEIIHARRAVLAITGLTLQEYTEQFIEVGLAFAQSVANVMPDPSATYYQLTGKATNNQENTYWSWFRFKYLLNDQEWYNQGIYAQPISYQQWKCYMIGDEKLEEELIEDLVSEKFQ